MSTNVGGEEMEKTSRKKLDKGIFNVYLYDLEHTGINTVRVWSNREKYRDYKVKRDIKKLW